MTTSILALPGTTGSNSRGLKTRDDVWTYISSLGITKAIPILLISMTIPFMAGNVYAHHSFAKFDLDSIVQIEGEIVDIDWRNPHVHILLRTINTENQVEEWNLETASPGILRRMEIHADMLESGSQVRVAGNPAVDDSTELNALNVLLPGGRELMLGPNVPSRFSGKQVGQSAAWHLTEGDASRPELGLFRIWSSTTNNAIVLFPDSMQDDFTLLDYPLTEQAREAVEAFDPVSESRRLADNCTPKGMPWIMEQPYDLAFELQGEDILLRLEEFDTVRRIHMNHEGGRDNEPYTLNGFSTGTWDGDSLVVRTTHIKEGRFKFEIPQSNQVQILERFTPADDGSRLEYEIEVTDPATFTETVSMEKNWIFIPDQELDAYNCGESL